MEPVKVGKASFELVDGETQYVGNPMAIYADADEEQIGTIQKFRVTTSDSLNHIFGIVVWPAAQPEVISVQRISGLAKYKRLESAGRISVLLAKDGNWLAELNVLKYGGKPQPTSHRSSWEELSYLLGSNASEFLASLGVVASGSREVIDAETNKRKGFLAVKVGVKDYKALAGVFTLTKVLSIMYDLGLTDEA